MDGYDDFIHSNGLQIENENDIEKFLIDNNKMISLLQSYLSSQDEIVDSYFIRFFKDY